MGAYNEDWTDRKRIANTTLGEDGYNVTDESGNPVYHNPFEVGRRYTIKRVSDDNSYTTGIYQGEYEGRHRFKYGDGVQQTPETDPDLMGLDEELNESRRRNFGDAEGNAEQIDNSEFLDLSNDEIRDNTYSVYDYDDKYDAKDYGVWKYEQNPVVEQPEEAVEVPATEQQVAEAEDEEDDGAFTFDNDARAGNFKEQEDASQRQEEVAAGDAQPRTAENRGEGEPRTAGNEPIVVDPQSMGVDVGRVQTELPSDRVGGFDRGDDILRQLIDEGFDPEQAEGTEQAEADEVANSPHVRYGKAAPKREVGERRQVGRYKGTKWGKPAAEQQGTEAKDDEEEEVAWENELNGIEAVAPKKNKAVVSNDGGSVKTTPVAEDNTDSGSVNNFEGVSSWDELQERLEEMDRKAEKRRQRNAWWELMTNALVGGANIYGTTKGAPALDLKTSEAYDKAEKDAYERLKDRKSQEMTFVQKQIEEIQKNREYERKLAVDEANINYKEQQLAIKDREVTARIKNMEDKVAAAKELQEWKEEVQRQKDQLTAERNEIAREKNSIAWYNARHKGGKGGSSSGASSKTLVSPDGKSVVFKSTDWIGMAKSARASSYECKTIAKAKEYLRTHIKEAREAKLIEE